ncbi:MAG: ribosome maturation factor RimM [Bacteroidota bacterium]
MKKNNVYKIGHIARTHGLKGEVTITLLPGELPENIESCGLDEGEDLIRHTVEHFSARPDLAFMKLSESNTLESAKALRGRSVFLEKKGRPKAAPGTVHDDEIIGFSVSDLTLGLIGAVENVSRQGGRGFLLIKKERREIIIPMDGPFITAIRKKEKKIEVDLPDGFLDL